MVFGPRLGSFPPFCNLIFRHLLCNFIPISSDPCQGKPLVCFHVVSRCAKALHRKQSQIVAAFYYTSVVRNMFGGLSVPHGCLCIVLRHAISVLVRFSKPHFRTWL